VPIDPCAGQAAVAAWSRDPSDVAARRTAVRFTLGLLAQIAPGRTVEVRVPPDGAVQAVAGPRHTRGTPPAVVQTDPGTWMRLVTGQTTWDEALADGSLTASGERCDLSAWLPLAVTTAADGTVKP